MGLSEFEQQLAKDLDRLSYLNSQLGTTNVLGGTIKRTSPEFRDLLDEVEEKMKQVEDRCWLERTIISTYYKYNH